MSAPRHQFGPRPPGKVGPGAKWKVERTKNKAKGKGEMDKAKGKGEMDK